MIKTFKIPRQPHLNHRKQKGAVLILFFFITLLIVSSIIVSRLNQNREETLGFKSQYHEYNTKVLMQAKEALLGFATSYAEVNGYYPSEYLPCPNITAAFGFMESSCPPSPNAIPLYNSIGCLPSKSLGLPRLQDKEGNNLWYAVSGNYKYNPRVVITPDSDGQLKVKDMVDPVIAVIITPNKTTKGTNITCDKVEKFLVDNGLLTEVSNTEWIFNETLLIDKGYQLTVIDNKSYAKVQEHMNKWLAERIKVCLNDYASDNAGKYPWVAKLQANTNSTGVNYDDTFDQRFGHLAQILDDTKITMSDQWPLSPYMNNKRCFDTDTNPSSRSWAGWWYAWQENVFVIVDRNYVPSGNGTGTPILTLDSTPTKFVIFVSGKKLKNQPMNQNRATLSDKIDMFNYLEEPNLSTIQAIGTGDEKFVSTIPIGVTAPEEVNDIICGDTSPCKSVTKASP